MSNTPRIIVPIITPFGDQHRLDEFAFRTLVDDLANRVDGIFVGGTSGELATMSDDEATRIASTAADQIAGRCELYMGIGDTGTIRTLRRIEALDTGKVDYLVACGPSYYTDLTQRDLIRHYLTVAEAAPAPLILYQIPQHTGTSLHPKSISELAAHANIAGMKDSSGNLLHFLEIVRSCPQPFAVYQGREQLAAASLWLGAAGLIVGLANLDPEIFSRLSAAVVSQDRELSVELQSRIDHLASILEIGPFLGVLKAAVEELGFSAGAPQPPSRPLSDGELEALRGVLGTADLRKRSDLRGASLA